MNLWLGPPSLRLCSFVPQSRNSKLSSACPAAAQEQQLLASRAIVSSCVDVQTHSGAATWVPRSPHDPSSITDPSSDFVGAWMSLQTSFRQVAALDFARRGQRLQAPRVKKTQVEVTENIEPLDCTISESAGSGRHRFRARRPLRLWNAQPCRKLSANSKPPTKRSEFRSSAAPTQRPAMLRRRVSLLGMGGHWAGVV